MTYFNFLDGGERSPTNIAYYQPLGYNYSSTYYGALSGFNTISYPIQLINNQYYFAMSFGSGLYNFSSNISFPLLSSSTIYFGARIYLGTLGAPIRFVNVNGNAQIIVTCNTNGGFTVTCGSNTLTTSANNLIFSGQIIYLEIYANINASTGAVIVRLNGNPTPIINISGVNTVNDSTSLPITQFIPSTFVISQSSQVCFWRDIYVHDGTGAAPYNNFLGSVGAKYLPATSNVSTSFVPDPTLVSVVQNVSQISSGDPSLTFTNPTTVGNYLVGLAFTNLFNISSGWSYVTEAIFSHYCGFVYQKITTSSTGPFTPFSGSSGCCIALYEISGLTGWNPDQLVANYINNGSGTFVFGSGTTSYANELQLTMCFAIQNPTSSPSLDVSYTTDSTVAPTNISAFNYNFSMVSGHRILGPTGSSLSGNVSTSTQLGYFLISFAQPSSTTSNYINIANSNPSLNAANLYINASSTVGASDTFAITQLPANTSNVIGLKTFDYSYKSDTGARSLAKTLTVGSTTVTGAVNYLGQNPIILEDIYLNQPNGGTWTASAVNSLNFGYKIIN